MAIFRKIGSLWIVAGAILVHAVIGMLLEYQHIVPYVSHINQI